MDLKFLHITKCAGTTIENAAKKKGVNWGRFDKELLENTIVEAASKSFWHYPLHYFNQDFLSKNTFFTVVRNPYERVVSEVYCPHAGIKNNLVNFDTDKYNKFIQYNITKNHLTSNNHWEAQSNYVFDSHNTRHVKHVLKLENFPHNFNTLMRAFSIKVIVHEKQRDNKSPNKIFDASHFNSKTLELINKHYYKDFLNFEYDIIKSI